MNTQRMLTQEELKAMNERMSSNTDALIARGYTKPQRSSAKSLDNTLKEDLSIIYNYCYTNDVVYPVWLDDLVTGASRMKLHGDKPLNRGSILKVLSSVETITTQSIMNRLNIKERGAQEYFACIRVIYPKLSLHVKDEIALIDEDIGGLFSDDFIQSLYIYLLVRLTLLVIEHYLYR